MQLGGVIAAGVGVVDIWPLYYLRVSVVVFRAGAVAHDFLFMSCSSCAACSIALTVSASIVVRICASCCLVSVVA